MGLAWSLQQCCQQQGPPGVSPQHPRDPDMDRGKEIMLERRDSVPWCAEKVAKGNSLGGDVLPFGLPVVR